MKKNTACSVNLDSFFSETIIDPRGNSITDINSGLDSLFRMYNEEEQKYTESQNYLVKEYEEAYPELVAMNSILNSAIYWWWILFINRLDDPFIQLQANWVYSVLNQTNVNTLIETANTLIENKEAQRIGNIIELN